LTRPGKILTSRPVCTIRRTGKGQGDRKRILFHELFEICMLTSCVTGTGLLTCIAFQSIRLSSKDIASLDQRRLQRKHERSVHSRCFTTMAQVQTLKKSQFRDDRVPLPHSEIMHWTLSSDLYNSRTYAKLTQKHVFD
jgi:hypothetical protein